MAAELDKQFNTKVKLIEGKGGVFEVTLNNHLIFSKKATKRFPNEGEIKNLISKS